MITGAMPAPQTTPPTYHNPAPDHPQHDFAGAMGYERLAAATGIITPVLVWLPPGRRETSAQKAFTTALHRLDRPDLVPVATTSPNAATDPTQRLNPAVARWAPVASRQDHERIALSDLTIGLTTTPCPPAIDNGRTSPDILAPPPPMPPVHE
jgi:hypothetical protein